MLELFDIHCKAAVIKMFQQAMTNSLETSENAENLHKEIGVKSK